MRLLNTHTLELESFEGDKSIPPYAILSHTWGKQEVSFQDVQGGSYKDMKGFSKILGSCRVATTDGFDFIWIDTCCIDKSSSAELSYAINSMYHWYSEAVVCYAYLADVPPDDGPPDAIDSKFRESRWFTRGWTLQELLAPSEIVFYGEVWQKIGTKSSLEDTLSSITGIRSRILRSNITLPEIPVAERMSWAAKRHTTRIEDLAYCLLGIFEINMPLLYGERDRAFTRLQQEIIKVSSDRSLFLWRHQTDKFIRGPLAPSPREFVDWGGADADYEWLSVPGPYSISNGVIKLESTWIEPLSNRPVAIMGTRKTGDGATTIHGIYLGYSTVGRLGRNRFFRISTHECFVAPSRPMSDMRTIYIVEPSEIRLRTEFSNIFAIYLDDKSGEYQITETPSNAILYQNCNSLAIDYLSADASLVYFGKKADSAENFVMSLGQVANQPWCAIAEFENKDEFESLPMSDLHFTNRVEKYIKGTKRVDSQVVDTDMKISVAIRRQLRFKGKLFSWGVYVTIDEART